MYRYTDTHLGGDWLAGARGCAARVDLQPGPGGSGMSDPTATKAAFWDHAGLAQCLPPGAWTQVRLVGLWPSQQIPRHADAPISGQRFHVPLYLNDQCWVFSAGVWQQLREGWIYEMDPTKPHGAVNWGDTIRLHLMIDVEA